MALSPALLEILVDPEDKQPLVYFAAEELLYNPRLQRVYIVREGIPVLLVNEARPLDADEAARLDSMTEAAVWTGHQSGS